MVKSYFSTSSFASSKSAQVLLYASIVEFETIMLLSVRVSFSLPSSLTKVVRFMELAQLLGCLFLRSVTRCARPSKIILLAECVSNLLMRPCLSNLFIIDLMVKYFLSRILAMSPADIP